MNALMPALTQRPLKLPYWILLLLLMPTSAVAQDPWLTDIAPSVGLEFTHFNGMSGEFYFPEMTGQGAAFLDYDMDGDLDVYLLQGAHLGPEERRQHWLFQPTASPPRDRLFRNDGPGQDGLPRFVDVTAKAGLKAFGYGMGVAVGDIDNDGYPDLYLANFGSNQLWRNRGNGSFEDITGSSKTDLDGWSVGATFFDYDRDGWLDLFVLEYVNYSIDNNITCYADSSRRDYCGPSAFPPAANRLLRNRGDGTFEDVTTKAGLAGADGASLGVVAADYDGNGWLDLFVANDGQANNLWLNQGNGTFVDDGLLAGVAVNRRGQAEASMGVASADFDGDGDEDLFMTHLMGETNTLYVNAGGLFEDRSIELGLAASSLGYTSFGTVFFDLDNDGWLDLLTVSGAVRVLDELIRAKDVFPLDQGNQLFRNVAGQGFEEVTAKVKDSLGVPEVSRGAAVGDIDNDGDADLLITNNAGPVRLLLNRAADGKPWLGLRLIEDKKRGQRDALAARVEIRRQGAASLWRRVATDGSYASASDPRIIAGLGGGSKITAVLVHWPDGQVEQFPAPPLGKYTTYQRGTGKAPAGKKTP